MGKELEIKLAVHPSGNHVIPHAVYEVPEQAEQRFSSGGNSAPQGTLGNVLGHLWLPQLGYSWHRVSGGQKCCLASHSAQDGRTEGDPAPVLAAQQLGKP